MPKRDAFPLRLRDNSIRTISKPSVMGIINTSPDSFHQPFITLSSALKAVEKMIEEGATFIDIGGAASNPFVDLEQANLSLQEEMDRVIPLIQAVARQFDVLISVDTSRPEIMREAIHQGAHLINDQQALKSPGALETLIQLKCPVCLMHSFPDNHRAGSKALPALMHQISSELEQSARRCIENGIKPDQIIIDPGFGGGNYRKTSQENFYILSQLENLTRWEFPVLIGWSRKSMIGEALKGAPPSERLSGSIAAATIAALQGAAIIRTHDVKETADALRIAAIVTELKN